MNLTITAPRLETERLTLQMHTAADHAASLSMWSDPEVTRFIGGKPSTAEEVWARLLRYVGLWAVVGYGYWVVRDRRTGAFVGEVGFADFRRDVQPSLEGAPEIGWALVPSAQGRGLATDAVRAAIAWGDVHLSAARTVCLIDAGNAASFRVADKCGYRVKGAALYKGAETTLLERDRPPS